MVSPNVEIFDMAVILVCWVCGGGEVVVIVLKVTWSSLHHQSDILHHEHVSASLYMYVHTWSSWSWKLAERSINRSWSWLGTRVEINKETENYSFTILPCFIGSRTWCINDSHMVQKNSSSWVYTCWCVLISLFSSSVRASVCVMLNITGLYQWVQWIPEVVSPK